MMRVVQTYAWLWLMFLAPSAICVYAAGNNVTATGTPTSLAGLEDDAEITVEPLLRLPLQILILTKPSPITYLSG